MPHFLVTGGGGFIGSHLAEALLARGDHVRVADNFLTGKRENLEHLRGVEIVEGDLADPALARKAVAGVDYVLHQAAIPSVPRSIDDPLTSHRSNVDGALNVLVAARDAGVRRVVNAGSSSVYGDAAVLPKHEGLAPNPQSPYALQKLMVERYATMFTKLYGLETVTIRYFNVFGPRQDPNSAYTGVISIFLKALLEGRPSTIHGDGEQTRDFTYVANVVDGVLRACTAPASGMVINVATGGRVSLNELYATLSRLAGVSIEPVYGAVRAGDVKHSQADITRARDVLGYEPKVSLEEGLKKTLEWFRARPASLPRVPTR
jgi:nucleoside-diphosphate-sugar epimerase